MCLIVTWPVTLENAVAFPLVVMMRQALLLLQCKMLGGGMIVLLIRPLASESSEETKTLQ